MILCRDTLLDWSHCLPLKHLVLSVLKQGLLIYYCGIGNPRTGPSPESRVTRKKTSLLCCLNRRCLSTSLNNGGQILVQVLYLEAKLIIQFNDILSVRQTSANRICSRCRRARSSLAWNTLFQRGRPRLRKTPSKYLIRSIFI